MEMEPQVCPNCLPQDCFNCTCVNQESTPEKDAACNVITPSQNQDTQKPVKKKTRQWAAWTRQEEERYFTALRQVGKNFEKITSRVQTKNKNQVRHYYYRLVRRMNKLLGPGVCLDAKNSKDTNAAMLRWWSLLEKFSWKVSKLHLKPRKFKIFVETLEQQLLKDQKKGRKRKQPEQESSLPVIPPLMSNQTGVLTQNNAAGNVILASTQNIKKPVKGSSTRRNANTKNNGSNRKIELPPVKKTTQRKKPSTTSTSSYKKWEKAAMAGVSLVADAAEHLERETVDKENACVNATLRQQMCDKDSTPQQVDSPCIFGLSNVQNPTKLKLQLFPVDDATRRAMEMDNHNPHLELTLGARKKISSVLEHLNRKWGNCSLASGELVLFPYNIQIENSVAHQRWTHDSILCAGDIHGLIGSPQYFRLRYGWFCKNKLPQVPLIPPCKEATNGVFGSSCVDNYNDHLESSNQMTTIKSLLIETNNQAIAREKTNMDDRRLTNGTSLSVGEWADSLTNISVGDLLTDVQEDINSNYVDQSPSRYCQSLEQPLPFNSDSFDAAIAAHIQSFNQKQTSLGPSAVAPSIWDAEETCDAFSFRKDSVHPDESHSISDMLVEDLANNGLSANDEVLNCNIENGDLMVDCQFGSPIAQNSPKDLNGLTDVYWSDSLGQLEMDLRLTEDILLSNSLNRLLANSLDAFQYCSISMDKKEKTSSTEVQNAANSPSDNKNSS